MKRLVVCAGAWGLFGCASLSTVQTAHTVKPGQTKIAANASIVGGGVPGLGLETPADPPFHTVPFPIPQAELEVRHGFAERWDWGARLYLLGAAADVKFQWLQGEKWDACFAPGTTFSYLYLGSVQGGEADVVLPVLFGRHVGESSSIVFGPKVQGRLSFTRQETPEVSGTGTRFILLGGGGGVLNVSLGKGWSIPLELSVYNDWTEKTGIAYSMGFGLSYSTDRGPRWRRQEQE